MKPLQVAALFTLAAVAAAPALASGGPFAFTDPVLVDPTDSSGEPSIAVSDQGLIYVSTLSVLHDTVHVSPDGGATFIPLHDADAVMGGGDDALALDHSGGVYLAGQWHEQVGCQSLSASKDAGATWFTTLAPCDGGSNTYSGTPLGPASDRPWVAVSQSSVTAVPTVMMVHHTPCCFGTHRAVVSHDGGITYADAGTVVTGGWFPGNLVADDAHGRFYYFGSGQPYGSTVNVAWTTDQGATWTSRAVGSAGGDPGLNHVTGAIDRAGNVYVVAGGSNTIQLWRSTDSGLSWSGPTAVSTSPSMTSIMPWIVAGDAGKIDVAWYGSTRAYDPNSMPGNAMWDVYFAQSLDGGSTWTQTKVTPMAIHRGVLCTRGAICASGTRDLLDFFMIALDPQGNANIVYAQDYNKPVTAKVWVTIDSFQRQTTGPGLYG